MLLCLLKKKKEKTRETLDQPSTCPRPQLVIVFSEIGRGSEGLVPLLVYLVTNESI